MPPDLERAERERLHAHRPFRLREPESAPVYIPVGPNNSLTGTAHDPAGQPVLFLPGGGAWDVPFDGGSLTWQVSSNRNNGTTGSIPANSANNGCSSGISFEHTIAEVPVPKMELYPNPSTGMVFLGSTEDRPAGTSVEVYNAMGAKCAVRIGRPTDQDRTGLLVLRKGMYMIMVLNEASVESYPASSNELNRE
ncbi:MAG: T9SS type A sorting domain-containing protein [Flavobacteriales bacterium]